MDRKVSFGEFQQLEKPMYPTNFIVTSKYNMVTFLPLSLFMQFNRMANIYFLIIAILSCFPVISPYSPFSAFSPLIFVVSLSMMRDAYEDWQRHKSDNELNALPTKIWNGNDFVTKTWKDVQVGDIMLIEEMEIISADVVVLETSMEGICFIETSSLDGEKNLKPKNAIKECQMGKIRKGTINCIPPNALLYNFDGVLYIGDKKISINHKHFLLRGSRLKNCKSAVGVVVYTGLDTKVMMNSDRPKNKMSNIDQLVNIRIVYILIIQLFCCTVVAILFWTECGLGGANFSYFNNYFAGYAPFEEPGCVASGFITLAAYFLLLNTLIPISLIVSLEFVKVAQGYFMEKDKDMFTAENEKYLKVFSPTINEELGQIQYIFTDKTGTLTCNKMEFKILVAGSQTYGDLSLFNKQEKTSFIENQARKRLNSMMPEESRTRRASTVVNKKAGVEYSEFKINTKDKTQIQLDFDTYALRTQGELVSENLLLLACCHECVLEEQENSEFIYQGPSPDEIALVDAARRHRYIYRGITMGIMKIEIEGKDESVELLNLFEFNSDRKRMSVIVKHKGIIKLYTKGADSIIQARLAKNQEYLDGVNTKLGFFSKKGLRTLSLAMRVLSEETYNDFANKMNETLGKDKAEQLQAQLLEAIEVDLTLIGATAVEDKLQEDVPETLADFLKANINVWMLTGDKLETAENIGRSCNLLQENMQVFYITPETHIEKVFQEIGYHIQHHKDSKRALIIEGLAIALIDMNPNLQSALIVLCPHLHSVICCRVTPKQKADMVRLVKNNLNKITLAVGDGANDVNMIMEANIGIGIYGQEGMRAVQSSNYAIGQFNCLWYLILYHGRMNYIRTSEMILYFFYKNIIFTVPQLYFAFFCSYTGTSIFDDYFVTLYNTVFTFWPVVIRAIFDEDVYYTTSKKQTITGSKKIVTDINAQNDLFKTYYPNLYYIGQLNTIFTSERFFKWFAIGVIQGLVCFFSFYFDLNSMSSFAEGGYTNDIWFFSIAVFTSIMILVTLKLALNTQFWTIITWVAYLVTSVGSYFAYVFISSALPVSQVYETSGMLFISPIFYLAIALSVLSMFSFDLLLFTLKTQKDTLLNYFKKSYRTQSALELEQIQKLDRKIADQYRQNIELQSVPEQINSLNSSIQSDRSQSIQKVID